LRLVCNPRAVMTPGKREKRKLAPYLPRLFDQSFLDGEEFRLGNNHLTFVVRRHFSEFTSSSTARVREFLARGFACAPSGFVVGRQVRFRVNGDDADAHSANSLFNSAYIGHRKIGAGRIVRVLAG